MDEVTAVELVEDNDVVPIPDGRRGTKSVRYPFDQMEVNRSFTVNRRANTLAYAVRRYRESGHEDRRFVVREVEDGKCRVWRVA